jgi:hypothetical protein
MKCNDQLINPKTMWEITVPGLPLWRKIDAVNGLFFPFFNYVFRLSSSLLFFCFLVLFWTCQQIRLIKSQVTFPFYIMSSLKFKPTILTIMTIPSNHLYWISFSLLLTLSYPKYVVIIVLLVCEQGAEVGKLISPHFFTNPFKFN